MGENMDEKIDILLATYNGEKFVREQLDSIINQTYKNLRIIISDDCSNDSTIMILEEYKNKDNRIEVYLQEKNLGVVKNIEFLLNKVSSNFYMLSDQDDYWLPQKVEKSIEKLKEENADLVFGDLEVVDEKLDTIYESFNDYMLLSRKIKKYINTGKMNYLYNCVTGCTILAKKETIEYIIPLPDSSKRLIHDHWIGIMTELNGKLAYMPEKYIKYRQHGDNQVGTEKISHGFKRLEQVRDLFIDVKLGVFGTYVENKDRFNEEIQKENEEALNYFKMLSNKKYFNFKNWNVFHRLYKTETFIYYIENFMILNIPFFTNVVFKIRHLLLKIRGKR